ncbi:hypothetical protein DAERI_170052 [Deinococcus aerius]|uniref:Ig-like domain-containing protein n=1 Tax=Deinococcus aerius TaxID=200253 RepID=A0A2I9CZV7_9DEIO|nr:hypothetical protein [Deinococcus aerius]GBF07793.1 hypothetical protein DAERI_170052 [Deinococcus aerius]
MKRLALLTLPLLLAACGTVIPDTGRNVTVSANASTITLASDGSSANSTTYTFTNPAGAKPTSITSATVSWGTGADQSVTVAIPAINLPAGLTCTAAATDPSAACNYNEAGTSFGPRSLSRSIKDADLFAKVLVANPSVTSLPITVQFNNTANALNFTFTSRASGSAGGGTAPVEQAPAPVLQVVGTGPFSSNMSVNVSGNFDSLSQMDRMILQIVDKNGVVDNTSYSTTQAQATFSVDTTKLANGNATLQVIAYTKSGLRGVSSPTTITVKNVLNPVLAVAAPSNGATVSSPTVPARVTLTKSGDTAFTFNPATVSLSLMDYRGQLIQQKTATCTPSTDAATYTCDTSFDIAGLPADTYTLRATAQVVVDGANSTPQTLTTESRFTSNTVSVNPPAATISFPTAVTLTGGTRIPARIDSGSGFFATVSDDKGIQYVEARLVGPYAEGSVETDGTRQCQASGSILPGESEINVLVLNVAGAANLPYDPQDVFIPKLDVDGSTYVPDSKPGQRYDMRVTTADTEGNRNIQCVPVRVERNLARPTYAVSKDTTPSKPNTTPGELTFTSGTWYLDNVPANSRVAAVFYANGKQVGTSFISKTNGGQLSVSQTFSDPGTYSVKWLIEDMNPTLTASTGVVTSQDGGYINVSRNPK